MISLRALLKPDEPNRGKGIVLPLLASLYLLLPGLIFLVGWTKWYWALLAVVVFVPSLVFLWKHLPPIRFPFPKTWQDALKFLCVSLVLFLLVRLSGIGNMSAITDDLKVRNTIFDILVRFDWPVRYFPETDYVMGYYIGFWLPAALVGKIFGLAAGYVFTELWTFAGLMIIYCFICALHNKTVLWPLFVFLFFSGMDIIPELINLGMGRNTVLSQGTLFPHIEWHIFDNFAFNMLSMVTNVYWIYNNTIPIWIAVLLLLFSKNNKFSVLILASTLLSSLLSAAGMLPLFLLLCFSTSSPDGSPLERKLISRKEIWPRIKELLSVENLSGGLYLALLSVAFLYVTPDPNQVVSNGVGFYFYLVSPKEAVLWFVAIFCEFGAFAVLCAFHNRRNILFHLSWLCLLFFPMVFVGLNQDFCMKGTVPYLLLLALFCTQSLERFFREKKFVRFGLLAATLAIGFITPLYEILRMGRQTFEVLYVGAGVKDAQILWMFLECLAIVGIFAFFLAALRPNLIPVEFGKWKWAPRVVGGVGCLLLLVGLAAFASSHFQEIPADAWNQQVTVEYIIYGPNFTHRIEQDWFYRIFAR